MKKLFLFLVINLCFTQGLYGFVGGNDAARLQDVNTDKDVTASTSNSNPQQANKSQFGNEWLDKIYREMNAIKVGGAVNCLTSFVSDGHALICNCANESSFGYSDSFKDSVAVTRVVFGRLKSQDALYRNEKTVRRVICKRYQFSYTINNFNSSCQRTGSSGAGINKKTVSGSILKQCENAIMVAAKKDFVEEPNKVFALSYLNPGASSDKTWLASCNRNLVGPQLAGGHKFCNPEGRGRSPAFPPPAEMVAKLFKNLFLKVSGVFFVNDALANISQPQIIKTKQLAQFKLGKTLEFLLKKQGIKFKPLEFNEYSKKVQKDYLARFNGIPMAVKGDFNGDNEQDYISLGHLDGGYGLIAFYGNKTSFNISVIKKMNKKEFENAFVDEHENKVARVLTVAFKKELSFSDGSSKDAYQLESPTGFTGLYYFHNGTYNFLKDGDKNLKIVRK